MPEELIVDLRGDADPAIPGESLGVLVGQKRTPDFERAAAAERPPSTAVNICWNIELRNIASNFSEAAFALVL